ncbi:DUF6318 family protein [Rothia nasimurium]|uniref:DUF6318 family protein n=1 Tax=Rothia nasimurium TaxID=85336 RepID=UPI003BA2EF09
MNTPKPHTLLTTLAITTLVLTGCGNTTQTAPLPEPTTSSTSASTATDTATSTATTAPAQASASPSQAYSGGSKAPEGEYRAADEFGPAQNVPKPVAPAGMNVESPEAMLLFITYWQDMRNYAYQTGDTSDVKSLVDESHSKEHEFYTALEEIYSSGGWVIAGGLTIHYNKDLIVSHGNGEYSIGSNFEAADSVLWYGEKAVYNDNSDSIYRGVDFRLKFHDGKWKVLSTKEIN